jgi:alginate O-acetyltransferase complex protein AlgI
MFPIDIDFSRLLEAFKYNPDAPMIFSSGIFLWLFAAFMVIYTLLQHRNRFDQEYQRSKPEVTFHR